MKDHLSLSRSQSTLSFSSMGTADSMRSLPENAYLEFEYFFIRDPIIALAFLTIAKQEGLDAEVEFPGAEPKYPLYDCAVSFVIFFFYYFFILFFLFYYLPDTNFYSWTCVFFYLI